MNFERTGKAKESMGIGLTSKALTISSIRAELAFHWSYGRRHNYKSTDYNLRKRWYIPTEWVIKMMNKEGVSVKKLRLFFKAKSQEADYLEYFSRAYFPWIWITRKNKKIRKRKKYVEVDLKNGTATTYNDDGSNRVSLNFIIASNDIKKLEEIKKSEESITKIIYKEKVYEINPDPKTLR